MYYSLSVILLLAYVRPSNQHGYLMTPPSRSSAWRFGYDTPPNYTDNELNCGGFAHQWYNNGGKCGECGDPWDVAVGERPNQAGGMYATGTIVGQYTAGETIDVVVKVTANHMGWFEFRLCPVNDPSVPATWACLNETKLQLEDGSYRHYIPHENMDVLTRVKLPQDVTCSQCVLQWMWHCGNNYGVFPNGTECIGCGPQEHFYGCADISITNGDGSTDEPSSSTTNPDTSTLPVTTDATTTNAAATTTDAVESTTTDAVESTTTDTVESTTVGSTTTRPSGGYDCEYVGPNSDDDMNSWCNTNCNHQPCYCPSDCVCEPGRPC